MDNDIFKAGVRPGSPASGDEVKMLVCYILSRAGAPMSFAQLHEAMRENDLVNYFELIHAVEGLKRTGHLRLEPEEPGAERYSVTEVGRETAEVFESSLPLAAREKAVQAAKRLLLRQQREAELRVEIRPSNGGFRLELAIPDHDSILASFSLFVATREECEDMRRRFLNDPLFIYKGVVALLTGNDKVLGDIFPQKEKLF